MPTYEQELALSDVTRSDEWYQQLLAQCEAIENDFLRIRASLSASDQELLDRYICLYENLEYRKTCLALELNKTKII